MMTSSALIQVLYDRLNASLLKAAINGAVYKMERPQNSTKEDVVINALPITSAQLQEGYLNVNVFVPDVLVTINGAQEGKPNTARLWQLEQLAVDALQEIVTNVNGHTVQYTVQQAYILNDDGAAQHYINIRVQFLITNI